MPFRPLCPIRQLHLCSGVAKGEPKLSTNRLGFGIRLKHVAGQFKLIVVKEFLLFPDSRVARDIVWQRASCPREIRFYQCPERA